MQSRKKKKSKKKRKTQENESSTNASSHNSALDEKLETAIDQLKEVPLSLSPSSTTAAKTFSLPRLHSPLATSIHMPQFLKIDNDDNDDSTKRDPTKAEFMDDDDIAYEAFKEVLCELKTKITNQNKFSIFKGLRFRFHFPFVSNSLQISPYWQLSCVCLFRTTHYFRNEL
jgi:hypothetical protein